MLKCPECGSDLKICVASIGQWSRKIKKNGEPGKTVNKNMGLPNGQGEFLSCQEYCGFIYQFWNETNRIEEFDNWYEDHDEGFFEY